MSDTKFTPATLYAHDDSHINKDGKRVGVIRITDSSESCGKWIGEVPPYGKETGNFPDHEEAIVYAQLFAAAPDLFDSVQYAIECLESMSNIGDAGDQALTALKAAYLKATGK